jgi:hypothetical protein
MKSWSHDDVFPIIYRLIVDAYARKQTFLPSREIAASMLSDPAGRAAVNSACVGNARSKDPEWMAHNMLAWFGQRISVGQSVWAAKVDRMKVQGVWAYKPRD